MKQCAVKGQHRLAQFFGCYLEAFEPNGKVRMPEMNNQIAWGMHTTNATVVELLLWVCVFWAVA